MGQLTQPHLPSTPNGCPKLSREAQDQWSGEAEKGPKWAGFSYEMGVDASPDRSGAKMKNGTKLPGAKCNGFGQLATPRRVSP